MTQPTLINLHSDEYSQGLHYYPFVVNLVRCVGSHNTLNDLSNRVHVPNKKDDLKLHVFDNVTEISESKTLTKYHVNVNVIDDRKCNSNEYWNEDKCWWECKNKKKHRVCEKDYVWNPAACSCENIKCVESVDDSWITRDEVINTTKTVPTNFEEKKVICKIKILFNLITFLLITIALLIAVNI